MKFRSLLHIAAPVAFLTLLAPSSFASSAPGVRPAASGSNPRFAVAVPEIDPSAASSGLVLLAGTILLVRGRKRA